MGRVLDIEQVYELGEVSNTDEFTIWRYMNFDSFINQLARGALFFARADRLNDSVEGFPSAITTIDRALNTRFEVELSIDERVRAIQQQLAFTRLQAYLNCWHTNDTESFLMWHAYTSNAQGVAIKSSIQTVRDCVCRAVPLCRAYKVVYLDYGTDSVQGTDRYGDIDFIQKRTYFESEREVRLLVNDIGLHDHGINLGDMLFVDGGAYVSVDFQELVHEIYVSPKSPVWFHETVKAVAQKYELGCPVYYSGI